MTERSYLDGDAAVHAGDCLEVLKTLADNSIDSVVTDPPYELGFMGRLWDKTGIANNVGMWAEILRVLKPGGHMFAFGGDRTYHRMVCAIEDAGFEIRRMFMWIYGQGFPKSRNIGNGWGTDVKPALEPICLARKPLSEKTVAANVLKWGTGALNIDATRIRTSGIDDYGRSAANVRGTINAHAGLFKIHERNGEYASNLGRWPANLCHDGSPEVLAGFPDTGLSSGGKTRNGFSKDPGWNRPSHIDWGPSASQGGFGDSGSAARFFYCAKASKDDRCGSKHPTVKPIALLQWLCRLITPRGGTILDPFAGTGTTGQAAYSEGFKSILIEREAEYLADIDRRMRFVHDSFRDQLFGYAPQAAGDQCTL